MERISALSREYLRVPVTAATVDGVTADPTGDVVEVAIIDTGTAVVTGDFETATWETVLTGGVTSDAATLLIGPGGSPSIGTFAAGFYDVYVRLTDSPEMPVELAGTIEIF